MMRDPKGYYVALGIEEDADGPAIKSAFRTKAKRLHPDFNPSPIAAKQFNRLHEAYATLIDVKRRAAYDRPWKSAPKTEPRSETRRAEPDPRARSETRTETPPPRRERVTPEPPPRRVDPDTPVTCQCGQITAQPRYILFDMVWGRLHRVQRRTVAGIFCRACADKAAIRASLVSWIAGWWAWPSGPRETMRAILTNIRGGRRPADRNARLLMRQARAFKSRGDLELAYSAALQARVFAREPGVRRDVEAMVASFTPPPTRVLKDRWSQPGWAPTLQMLPLALFGAIVAGSITLSLPHSLFTMPRPAAPAVIETAPTPAKSPLRSFSVTSETAALRTGPNEVFEVVATLSRGDKVTSLEIDPGGAWLRVAQPDGTVGFLPTAQLGAVE